MLAPAAGETVQFGELRRQWRACSIVNGTMSVNGAKAGLGNAPNVVCYFLVYITALKDTPVTIYWSSSDSGKAWLNGREIGRFQGARRCLADQEAAPGQTLKAGSNTLLIKVLGSGTVSSVAARITDPKDWPQTGLPLHLTPPGKEAVSGRWQLVNSGQEPLSGPLGTYLVAGQLGYLPGEEKMALATSRAERIWRTVELRDAASDAVVFRIPQDGGAIDKTGYFPSVTQNVSRVYFGDFKKPGRYVLYDPETKIKSLPFDIKADVYHRAAIALTKAMYFQRSGTGWEEQYAGKWARPAYHDLERLKNATLREWDGRSWAAGVGTKQLDPTPHDVSGGWLDAGDCNLYTKNEAWAHNVMLVAWDLNSEYLKDGDLHIPESGNKFPDLLDETRYTTDYLLRIQLPDGRVFDRTALGTRYDIDVKASIAPSADLAEPCSGATLCVTIALAYAAAVWQESGLDAAYAKRCLMAAQKSWKYMNAHPCPWPATADGKPKKIGSIDSSYGDEDTLRATAAAALFRATGEGEYKSVVEAWIKTTIGKAKAVDKPESHEVVELGYKADKDLIVHLYMRGKGIDSRLVAEWGTLLAGSAKLCRDEASRGNKRYEYGAGLPNYHWGTTAGICSRAAWMLWWAKNFASREELPSYIQAAREYMQFILGRNPTRWTLVTNLQDYGATRSPQVMFHSLVLNLPPEEQDKYFTPTAEHPDRIGVMPGYLLGGPSRGPTDLTFKPEAPNFDFEHMEPSLMYQCQGILLATCLASFSSQ